MKRIVLSFLTLVVATMGYAQSTLVATLTHGDDIYMFYGSYALQLAHDAAANGDVINLSGGGFQSAKITKALTIRGTGVLNALPTTLNYIDIQIPETTTERLSFEGCIFSNRITVHGTLINAYFLKTVIQEFYIHKDTGKMINGTFVNCNVNNMLFYGASTVQFINSYVSNYQNYSFSKEASTNFINCIVIPLDGYKTNYLYQVQLINSIICNDNNLGSLNNLPSSSNAWNSVACGTGNTNVFAALSNKWNCTTAGLDIFINGNAMNDLTDEAKARYLGNDGTPVGMYGGPQPYNMTPSYPQITKMNVANKTSIDGKLRVEIEVSE